MRCAVMLCYLAFVPGSLLGIVLGDTRLPEVGEPILQELEFLKSLTLTGSNVSYQWILAADKGAWRH